MAGSSLACNYQYFSAKAIFVFKIEVDYIPSYDNSR